MLENSVTRGPLKDQSSGSPTTGGDDIPIAANPARRYLFIQCFTNTMYVNFGAAASAAAGSIKLAAGASITYETNFIPTDAVHVFGGSGAGASIYTVKEG